MKAWTDSYSDDKLNVPQSLSSSLGGIPQEKLVLFTWEDRGMRIWRMEYQSSVISHSLIVGLISPLCWWLSDAKGGY